MYDGCRHNVSLVEPGPLEKVLVISPAVTVQVFDTGTAYVSKGKPPLVRGLGLQEGGMRRPLT